MGHAVLIVGYDEGSDGKVSVLINDPFPYDQAGVRDPYTPQGGARVGRQRCRVAYDALVHDLVWGNSIARITAN